MTTRTTGGIAEETGTQVEDKDLVEDAEDEAQDLPEALAEGPQSPTEDAAAGARRAVRVLRWPGRMPRRFVAAVAALVFLTTAATAVIQWREAHRLGAQAATEQRIRARSAEFGQALLAYRYTDLASAGARIRALASDEFGRTYETAFSGLSEVITKYQATATATIRDTYLNDFDGQRAKTLVVLDSEVHSTLGVRRVTSTRLLLELVLEHGAWRVDGMSTLAADDETLTKPDGTTERPQEAPAAPKAP